MPRTSKPKPVPRFVSMLVGRFVESYIDAMDNPREVARAYRECNGNAAQLDQYGFTRDHLQALGRLAVASVVAARSSGEAP